MSCRKAAVINISALLGSFQSIQYTYDVLPAISYRISKVSNNLLTMWPATQRFCLQFIEGSRSSVAGPFFILSPLCPPTLLLLSGRYEYADTVCFRGAEERWHPVCCTAPWLGPHWHGWRGGESSFTLLYLHKLTVHHMFVLSVSLIKEKLTKLSSCHGDVSHYSVCFIHIEGF